MCVVTALSLAGIAASSCAGPIENTPGARPPATEAVQPAWRPAPPLRAEAPIGDTLDAWVTEVRPRVERVAGRAFRTGTPVLATTNDELARILAKPIERDIRAARPGLIPVAARANAMSLAYSIATRTLGVYAHEQRTIYVVPENIESITGTSEIPADLADRVLRLTIAHELVHALQDQHVGLSPRGANAASGEARQAFTAVVEGHAVWVTRRIAEQLGWTDAKQAIMKSALRSSGAPREPEVGETGMPGSMDPGLVYRAGADFIARRFELGGLEAVWMALRVPPTRTEDIRRPDQSGPPAFGHPGPR